MAAHARRGAARSAPRDGPVRRRRPAARIRVHDRPASRSHVDPRGTLGRTCTRPRKAAYERSGISEAAARAADIVETQAQRLQDRPDAYRRFCSPPRRLALGTPTPPCSFCRDCRPHPASQLRRRCCSTREASRTSSTALHLAREGALPGGDGRVPPVGARRTWRDVAHWTVARSRPQMTERAQFYLKFAGYEAKRSPTFSPGDLLALDVSMNTFFIPWSGVAAVVCRSRHRRGPARPAPQPSPSPWRLASLPTA